MRVAPTKPPTPSCVCRWLSKKVDRLRHPTATEAGQACSQEENGVDVTLVLAGNLGCGPSHAAPRVNPAAIAPLRTYDPSPRPLSPSAADRASPLFSPHSPTGHRIGLPVLIIKSGIPGILSELDAITHPYTANIRDQHPNRRPQEQHQFAPSHPTTIDDRRRYSTSSQKIPTSWIPNKFTDTTSSRRRFVPWSLTFSSVARSNTVTQPLLTSVVTLSVPKHEPRWSRYVLPA